MLVALAGDGPIRLEHLPMEVRTATMPVRLPAPAAQPPEGTRMPGRDGLPGPQADAPPGAGQAQGGSLRQHERQAIEDAIAAAHGNMTEAARRLGIARSTLYVRLSAHGIMH